MAKTKSVGGKEYAAGEFAYVGDPNDISTWHLPIPDAAHVRDAMARFNQTGGIPANKKAGVARKIAARAKKYGIDASGFEKEYVKTAQAMSMEDRVGTVDDALDEKFGRDARGYRNHSIVSTFDNYVITRDQDGKLYKVPYSSDSTGEMNLESPQQVEVAYVPVRQAACFLAREAADTEEGYPVQIMEAGEAKGTVDGESLPHYFTSEVVAQFAAAANGARFGRRHPAPLENADDPARIAGWFSEGKVVGQSARARLHLLKNENELKAKIDAARDAGKMDLFGLSVFGYAAFKPGTVDGKKYLVSQKLGKLVSIDLVTEAGAGGKFLQVAASSVAAREISAMQDAERTSSAGTAVTQAGSENHGESRTNGGAMKERILKVLEALRAKNAGRADELKKKVEAAKDEQLPEIFTEVAEAASQEAEKAGDTTAIEKMHKEIKEAAAAVAKAHRATVIEARIKEAKLKVPAENLVREHLAALGDPTDVQVEAEIKRTREAFAAFETTGRVHAGGIQLGRNSDDKVALALAGMMGVKEALKDKECKPFRSIKEAYIHCTGDGELDFGDRGRGGFLKISEATALTSTFPNLLLDALNKRLLQDYADPGLDGVEKLVTEVDIADFKPQHRVRMGYLGDVAQVAEDAAYVDFTLPTDEQITYSAVTFGNTFPISRRTILNDDLNKIVAVPSRMGRAMTRTLKTFILNFFINNSTYAPDTTAWFTVGHNNLGTAPLSIPELIGREIALRTQTEKDSGKPIDLPLQWLMVPIHLNAIANQINNSETYNPGPNIFLPNPFYKRFGQNGENIITTGLLDQLGDFDDWYCGCLPSYSPFLEIGYVQGNRAPQMFLQNDPQAGVVFSNDRITYKVRFEFGGNILDFRPVQKNLV